MNVYGIQIISLIIAVFIIYKVSYLYKKEKFSIKDLKIWIPIVSILFLLSLLPIQVGFYIKKAINVKRALDAFLTLGLLAMFGMVFQLYVKIQEISREITELVRKVAIEFEERKK